MKAKNYLSELKKLDRLIENKLFERDQWLAIATNTTQHLTADRVQTSRKIDKLGDAVCDYVKVEAEIDAAIDKLVDRRREIIATIETLNVDHYDLLHKVYVQYWTLQDVADAQDKTYSSITTMHGRALKCVQAILDKRENG